MILLIYVSYLVQEGIRWLGKTVKSSVRHLLMLTAEPMMNIHMKEVLDDVLPIFRFNKNYDECLNYRGSL